MSYTENWMSNLGDHRRLNDIIMPGSHDAGMSIEAMAHYPDSYRRYKAGRTQNINVEEQCNAGSRFFDIRMGDVKIGDSGKKESRARHQPGFFGFDSITAFGEKESEIFNGVRKFLDRNKSEIVLLRISKSDTSVLKELQEDVKKMLGHTLYMPQKTCENLLTISIGQLRGKAIVLLDDKGDTAGYIDQKNGLNSFINVSKNTKKIAHATGPNMNGLTVCGNYSNAKTFQKMIGNLGDVASGVKKKNGQVGYWGKHATDDCGAHGAPHLFMLYWTFTSTDINNDVSESTKRENEGLMSDAFLKKQVSEPTSPQSKSIKGIHERIKGVHARHHQIDPKVNPGGDIYSGDWAAELMGPDGYYGMRKLIIDQRLNSLTAKSRCMPNVVMYDFVNSKTSEDIIRLNHTDILNEIKYNDEWWEF